MHLHKLLKIIMMVLSVTGIVFMFMVIFNSPTFENPTITTPFIYIAYAILFLAIIITLIFFLKQVTKKMLLYIGLFAAVVIISYVLSGAGESVHKGGVQIVSATASKWIDAGLWMFYILGVISLGTVVHATIRKFSR